MKNLYSFIALLIVSHVVSGAILVPSGLDPKFNEAREKVFIPWCTPEESGVYWKKLASSNVPIYCDFKPGNLSRDLYIPNPGVGYWVLGGLSEAAFWKTQNDKIKIGDELVSASVHKDERGTPIYWALWAPKDRSYLIKDKMNELGITPARVVLNFTDKLKVFSGNFEPFLGIAVIGVVAIQLILLVLVMVLLVRSRKLA